ncbi:uncharacterized protein LOC117652526 isoform X2 [Thrips palmi]|uniref:Uncharacterized protein LOC117652526 isoform X2 n=1 Tax=Thrips palmi TaxID=161013 RepID=A0A6P9ABN7_THRPL|nr:uncharacterized protein LOC117652526 isoform X2 [Thrips palmi]
MQSYKRQRIFKSGCGWRNLGTQPLPMDSDDESTNLDAEDDSNTFKTPVLPSNAAPTAHGDARFDSNDEDDPDELQTPAQPSTPRGTANATSTDHATPPPNVPPEDSPFTTTPRRRTRIGVSIDMQFSTRFNGKKYDSLAGQSTMIGLKSKKICGWESLTRKCWKCERGRPHLCKGVFKGSAKAMEPEAAVRLICKNSSLNEANVVVAAVAGDDDAASASAIRHNSTTHIVKWSDHNHTVKSVKNGLFVIQARFPKIFPKSYINYFLSCYSTAVKQNKGNPKGLRRNLKALVPHAFGDHGTCGAWCGFIKNPATYKHKYFEDNGKDLAACEPLRRDLEAHFRRYIIRAATIAPAASSQKNEAVNNVFISKSAKRTFTGGTWRHTYAIASGVAQTNIGTSYQKNVYSALALSPSKGGDKYREKKDVWRKRVAHIKSQQAAKIRRKYLAQHRSRVKVHVEGGEGISYEPGMGFNRPVDESVRSGGVVEPVVQRPVPDHNDIKLIYFDVETDGHGNIIEMGAKCDDGDHATFQKYAYPPKDITEHVTRVTSLSIIEGELCYKGNAVTCSSLFAVINSFFVFLRKFEKPIVLIAHHAHSDAYALIKGCADFYLLPSLAELVIGFVDTLPLFKKNPVILAEALAEQSLENKMKLSFSQSTLASKYVPNFRLEDAHGALYDSEILLQLCTALDVTRQDLLSNITLLSHFVDRQVELRNKKIFSPGLAVMVGPGISKMTTEKIAEKGFTVGALAQKLLDDGQERFAQWFKDLNNRKTALVAVIDYLCAWLDLNKDDVNVMDL